MTIFLDANDEYWILAHTRAELFNALLEHVDLDNDDHLLRLDAACLGGEEEDIYFQIEAS